MSKEQTINVVPIERVSQSMRQTEDGPTHKMIARMEKILNDRYAISIAAEAIKLDSNSLRFPQMVAQDTSVTPHSIPAALRMIGEPQLPAGTPLQMVSGICLFGAAGLTGQTVEGEVVSLVDPVSLPNISGSVVQVQESSTVQPYEAEAVLKLVEGINFLFDTQKTDAPVELFLHVPSTEYKLYMLDLVERGVLNADQLPKLFGQIEERTAKMLRLLTKRLRSDITVTAGTPLADLELVINQDNPSTDEIISAANKLPLVGRMITELGFQDSPLQSIPNYSYTAGYLQIALAAQASEASCLAVDPVEEEPIYRYSKATAESWELGINMAVMQLPPKVVSQNGRHDNQALFMHQPGTNALQELKVIVAQAAGVNRED